MYTPLMTPMGIAMVAASPVSTSVPTNALSIPPPVSPTGRGIWVKKPIFNACTP
jgi:hypothetical protein